eukprot:TRINITY_DN14050_c3_g1_i1.p1 TRINITY_DN14050_c3_g1~~TRINITY_DN14050_c3_g1_i1.p1  ORF type:complete len:335 (+),score=47.31 TRINITY_DN14050_c3_g1_i1:2-1006(+)
MLCKFFGSAAMFITQTNRLCFQQQQAVSQIQRQQIICAVKLSKRSLGLSGSVGLFGSVFIRPCQSLAEFLRSINSQIPAVLTIQNDTTDTLKAYWLNYDGDLEYYSEISPGQEWTVDTYESHPWRFVDEQNDIVVKEYIAQSGEQFLKIDSTQNLQLSANSGTRPIDKYDGFDGLGGLEDDYARAKVGTVSMDPGGGLVQLKIEGEEVALPIYIGFMEASSLLFASGMETRRPTTINTWNKILKLTGTEVERMLITRLVGDTYYARIILKLPSGEMRCVDSRPSDGLAVALANDKPVFVSRGVLKEKLSKEIDGSQIQGPGRKQVIIPSQGKEA